MIALNFLNIHLHTFGMFCLSISVGFRLLLFHHIMSARKRHFTVKPSSSGDLTLQYKPPKQQLKLSTIFKKLFNDKQVLPVTSDIKLRIKVVQPLLLNFDIE